MNTVELYIQNENGEYVQWKNVVLPVKFGQFLDEQLDYAVVSLMRVKRRVFKPLTRVKLVIKSKTEYEEEPQTLETEYFIANDDFTETPVGSGVYNHELSLIELTKLLECFPVESLCITNPHGNDYTQSASAPELISTITD